MTASAAVVMVVFCGDHVLCARMREANHDADGGVPEPKLLAEFLISTKIRLRVLLIPRVQEG
jgi:hypothetical protein